MKKVVFSKVFYIALAIACIIVFLLYSYLSYMHYKELRDHQEYFEDGGQAIESWMTPVTIIERYKVSPDVVFRTLSINAKQKAMGEPVDRICERKHLNCTEVVATFNAARQK